MGTPMSLEIVEARRRTWPIQYTDRARMPVSGLCQITHMANYRSPIGLWQKINPPNRESNGTMAPVPRSQSSNLGLEPVMKLCLSLAASMLALSGFLAAGSAVAQDNAAPAAASAQTDANGMPTDHSTPAEHAATADLNNQVSGANANADAQSDQNNAQYRAQQQQYQNQLQQNQAAQSQFQDQTIAYETLRTHYAEERSAYHRALWPDRYRNWSLDENDGNLIGQRVELVNGNRVGIVTDVAHPANGRVEALRVRLDSGKVVWIDQADVRYDRADGVVMTNLDRTDLRQMADERM